MGVQLIEFLMGHRSQHVCINTNTTGCDSISKENIGLARCHSDKTEKPKNQPLPRNRENARALLTIALRRPERSPSRRFQLGDTNSCNHLKPCNQGQATLADLHGPHTSSFNRPEGLKGHIPKDQTPKYPASHPAGSQGLPCLPYILGPLIHQKLVNHS